MLSNAFSVTLNMICSHQQGRKYTIERMPEAFGAPKG